MSQTGGCLVFPGGLGGIRGDSGTSDIRALIRFGQVISELFHKYFKTVLIWALSFKSRLPAKWGDFPLHFSPFT